MFGFQIARVKNAEQGKAKVKLLVYHRSTGQVCGFKIVYNCATAEYGKIPTCETTLPVKALNQKCDYFAE